MCHDSLTITVVYELAAWSLPMAGSVGTDSLVTHPNWQAGTGSMARLDVAAVFLVLVVALAVDTASGQAAYFYGDGSCTDLVVRQRNCCQATAY